MAGDDISFMEVVLTVSCFAEAGHKIIPLQPG